MYENTSLATADKKTHVKVVVMSLVAAIAVMVVGLTARIEPASTNVQVSGPVVKATKVIAVTRAEGNIIR